MKNTLFILVLAAGCGPLSVGEVEEASGGGGTTGSIYIPAKRAILACDPDASFTNECISMAASLKSRGWLVRRPGELQSDYFPTAGTVKTLTLQGTVQAGTWVQYKFPVSAGGTLSADLGGSGNADLYVRGGSAPTTVAYDCRPYSTSSYESCPNQPGGRMVYVAVNGSAASSDFTLSITWTQPTGLSMTGLVNSYINSHVNSGDQVLFYLNAHGVSSSTPFNDLSANPQAPFPFDTSGAYAAGPITSDRWSSMSDWWVDTSAANYSDGQKGVQSWDVHNMVQTVLGRGAKMTVVARDGYDGAFTEMFQQEYGDNANLCVLGNTSAFVSTAGIAAASDYLTNIVLANPGSTFSMDHFRRWMGNHQNPARNDSSGFSNGCMATMDYRNVMQVVYDSLGTIQGGSVAAQPSYVFSKPFQFTVASAAAPANPSSNPTADSGYHFVDGAMNWLSATRTRMIYMVNSLPNLSQSQKDGISTLTTNYASTAAAERTAWSQLDTVLVASGGQQPAYSWNGNLDLYYQLLSFAQSGQTIDTFLRRSLESRCLCGNPGFAAQSSLDCTSTLPNSAAADLDCNNPTQFVNDVLAFYPNLKTAYDSANGYRTQMAGRIQALTSLLTTAEQFCSSTACSTQPF